MGGDHKCPVCQATFTRPQHVARHMRSHTGDRPYKCQYCGDQFARSDLLSRHINKCHASEKPLPSIGSRRKGSASASRATTSKQACDQCVQASLPCDGCNPCAKCVQRKCRCTFVKFHRQTAPAGPGHAPRIVTGPGGVGVGGGGIGGVGGGSANTSGMGIGVSGSGIGGNGIAIGGGSGMGLGGIGALGGAFASQYGASSSFNPGSSGSYGGSSSSFPASSSSPFPGYAHPSSTSPSSSISRFAPEDFMLGPVPGSLVPSVPISSLNSSHSSLNGPSQLSGQTSLNVNSASHAQPSSMAEALYTSQAFTFPNLYPEHSRQAAWNAGTNSASGGSSTQGAAGGGDYPSPYPSPSPEFEQFSNRGEYSDSSGRRRYARDSAYGAGAGYGSSSGQAGGGGSGASVHTDTRGGSTGPGGTGDTYPGGTYGRYSHARGEYAQAGHNANAEGDQHAQGDQPHDIQNDQHDLQHGPHDLLQQSHQFGYHPYLQNEREDRSSSAHGMARESSSGTKNRRGSVDYSDGSSSATSSSVHLPLDASHPRNVHHRVSFGSMNANYSSITEQAQRHFGANQFPQSGAGTNNSSDSFDYSGGDNFSSDSHDSFPSYAGGNPDSSYAANPDRFSSTFGLMSLDDPNVLAGLATDGVPFFSAQGMKLSGSEDPDATPIAPPRSGGPQQHPNQRKINSASASTGSLPLSTPARDIDMQELNKYWKQYIRTPLSGPMGPDNHNTNNPKPISFRRPRVASLPSAQTPIVERGSMYGNNNQGNHGMNSSIRTTLHTEDLRSYEAAVLARKAPTTLNLGPRARERGGGSGSGAGARGRNVAGSAGTSPMVPSLGLAFARSQEEDKKKLASSIALKQEENQGPSSRVLSAQNVKQDLGDQKYEMFKTEMASPGFGGHEFDYEYPSRGVGGSNGKAASDQQGQSYTSSQSLTRPGSAPDMLASSSLAGVFGRSVRTMAGRPSGGPRVAFSIATPPSRESSVDSGESPLASSGESPRRPSFKRLPSQTLGPDNAKRMYLGNDEDEDEDEDGGQDKDVDVGRGVRIRGGASELSGVDTQSFPTGKEKKRRMSAPSPTAPAFGFAPSAQGAGGA